jgi:predicted nuclease of predicted toxin-antitoxin system
MGWVPIQFDRPTRKEAKRLLGEVRFYIDHDVDNVVVEILRWLKYDVETAKDVGAEAQRDEWHFGHAFRTKRVLLTKDKDYLDDERFPLSQTRGVIILNIDTANPEEIARSLEVIDVVLSKLRHTLEQAKVILNSDYTLTIIHRVPTGEAFDVQKTRYRVRPDGTDKWTEDDV